MFLYSGCPFWQCKVSPGLLHKKRTGKLALVMNVQFLWFPDQYLIYMVLMRTAFQKWLGVVAIEMSALNPNPIKYFKSPNSEKFFLSFFFGSLVKTRAAPDKL